MRRVTRKLQMLYRAGLNINLMFMALIAKKNITIALLILIFGFATIISGGKALFTDIGLKTRGNILPLVLWFNFIAGFLYILTGVLTFRLISCAKKLSILLAITNVGVLIYLLNHIYQGGLYETRTLIAMSFRTIFWILLAVYFLKSKLLNKSKM